MGDLNDKVGSDNTFLGHVTQKCDLGDHSNNKEKVVNFCNFHRLAISPTIFKQKTSEPTYQQRTFNQGAVFWI